MQNQRGLWPNQVQEVSHHFYHWNIFYIQKSWNWKLKVKSLSRVRLFATSWTVAHQAPPSMGLSSQEYWSGLPFPSPEDLPDPGTEPRSPASEADALTSEPPGKHNWVTSLCASWWLRGYLPKEEKNPRNVIYDKMSVQIHGETRVTLFLNNKR